MKAVMVSAAPQGLHVDGCIRVMRHVCGQPPGLRKDVTLKHVKPAKASVQLLSRRLSLRVLVDMQRGANLAGEGLSVADREAIVAGFAQNGVCAKLGERSCTVRFAKVVTAVSEPLRPLALHFVWDASSIWFPGGLEAALVSGLQVTLLTLTPPVHTDKDRNKRSAPEKGTKPASSTQAGAPADALPEDCGAQRATGLPAKKAVDECRVCGSNPSDLAPAAERVPGVVELLSADIAD